MEATLDIVLTSKGKWLYQAEGRDADGSAVARHTFRHRPDLLTTHQRLRALEQGAALSSDDEAQVPALLAEAETFGRDLYQRLFSGDPGISQCGWRASPAGVTCRGGHAIPHPGYLCADLLPHRLPGAGGEPPPGRSGGRRATGALFGTGPGRPGLGHASPVLKGSGRLAAGR